jgi:hypothetical protein
MTYDELYKAVLVILPGATIEEDNDGQLMIYTGLKEVEGEENLQEESE